MLPPLDPVWDLNHTHLCPPARILTTAPNPTTTIKAQSQPLSLALLSHLYEILQKAKIMMQGMSVVGWAWDRIRAWLQRKKEALLWWEKCSISQSWCRFKDGACIMKSVELDNSGEWMSVVINYTWIKLSLKFWTERKLLQYIKQNSKHWPKWYYLLQ